MQQVRNFALEEYGSITLIYPPKAGYLLKPLRCPWLRGTGVEEWEEKTAYTDYARSVQGLKWTSHRAVPLMPTSPGDSNDRLHPLEKETGSLSKVQAYPLCPPES